MESKNKYFTPSIESIRLDNEISLALESTPPAGPDESFGSSQPQAESGISNNIV